MSIDFEGIVEHILIYQSVAHKCREETEATSNLLKAEQGGYLPYKSKRSNQFYVRLYRSEGGKSW